MNTKCPLGPWASRLVTHFSSSQLWVCIRTLVPWRNNINKSCNKRPFPNHVWRRCFLQLSFASAVDANKSGTFISPTRSSICSWPVGEAKSSACFLFTFCRRKIHTANEPGCVQITSLSWALDLLLEKRKLSWEKDLEKEYPEGLFL